MAGIRTLAANPAFTLTSIAVLAIGIGANSTMFSVVSTVLLHPVAWEDPGRLVMVQEVQRDSGDVMSASTANFVDLRDHNDVFERMAPSRFVYYNLSDTRAEPERVQGLRVTSDFFRLIGVKPAMGRLFAPAEEQPGGDRVVLLANGFWRRRYGSDPRIAGKTIVLEGEPHTVVGVLPEFPIFHVLNRALDLYTPLTLSAAALSREDHSITVYARLRPGVSLEMAQSEAESISRRLAGEYPKTNTGVSIKVTALLDAFTRSRRAELGFLMSAAAFVLLIACANIASLTLAWTLSRRRELAVRMALGARRLRIVRELMGESLLVSAAGAVLGLLLAAWATALLNRSLSYSLMGRIRDFQIGGEVLAFAAGSALFGCLLFGLGPAVLSSKFEVNCLLAGAGSKGASGRHGASRILIACEIALATMLLTGAAVVVRSTMRLVTMDRGIDSSRVLVGQLWLPPARYPTATAERQFVDRLLDRVRAVPGVERASAVNYPPLGLLGTVTPFDIEGRPSQIPGAAMITRFRVIEPEFFRALRLPVIAGRSFARDDADASGGVAIVSETFARRFFPGEDAIGKFVRPRFPGGDAFWYPAATSQPLRIVGIARDLREDGIDVGPLPQVYLPYAQNPSRILHLLVRTQGPPLHWAAGLRSAVLEIDRDEPLFEVRTYDDILQQTFSRQRAFGGILAAAAWLALILAVSGVYALLAWAVSRQDREIGIRKAIGAAPGDVAWFVAWQALGPAAVGLAAGFAGALALHGTLTKLVVGIDRMDYTAFAWSAAALLLAALSAGVVPLRRALRIDPAASLRME